MKRVLKDLSKLEELVVLAIWHLKDNAYGVKIKKKVKELSGREYFYNTLYTTFDQLTKKEYITKHFGHPSAVRGGKRKVYFKITTEGMKVLKNAYERNCRVWKGITSKSFTRGYSQ